MKNGDPERKPVVRHYVIHWFKSFSNSFGVIGVVLVLGWVDSTKSEMNSRFWLFTIVLFLSVGLLFTNLLDVSGSRDKSGFSNNMGLFCILPWHPYWPS